MAAFGIIRYAFDVQIRTFPSTVITHICWENFEWQKQKMFESRHCDGLCWLRGRPHLRPPSDHSRTDRRVIINHKEKPHSLPIWRNVTSCLWSLLCAHHGQIIPTPIVKAHEAFHFETGWSFRASEKVLCEKTNPRKKTWWGHGHVVFRG